MWPIWYFWIIISCYWGTSSEGRVRGTLWALTSIQAGQQTSVACLLSGWMIISRGREELQEYFDDLKHFFFFGSNHCLCRSCMCVLFISNMFFFSLLLRLCTQAGCFLVNCGRVSREKWTFWLFRVRVEHYKQRMVWLYCFFYSVDVGHNKMSGAMTIWSCFGLSCQRFSCKHGSFESVDNFQDHITWIVSLVSYRH